MEFVIILLVVLFVVLYRQSNGTSVYKFVVNNVEVIYEKYAPYSFKVVREKCKEMGLEYTTKQYTTQVIIFAIMAFVISYLYFYNMLVSIVYVVVVISIIPYLTYLRCKRIYSEFLFEQIQVYTTNTIMEFQTTQNFVKAIEGVWNSGVLDSPVKDDSSQAHVPSIIVTSAGTSSPASRIILSSGTRPLRVTSMISPSL